MGPRRRAPGLVLGAGQTPHFGGWSLRRRVALLAIVLAIAVAVAWVWATVSFHSLRTTLDAQSDRIQPARSAVELLESALLSEDIGIRGYMITGQTAQLKPYRSGAATAGQEARVLPGLLRSDPTLAHAVADTVRTARAWRTDVAVRAITLASGGNSARSVDTALRAYAPHFRAVLATFPALNKALAKTDANATAKIGRTTHTLALILFLAGLVTFAAALTSVLLVRRWVTRPIMALHDDIRVVASGELDHEISTAGPPELASVVRDVEAMRQRIVDELASLRTAQLEIGRQAEELRRSNLDLEQFAYVASHDLQEPLRKVASFCELLERRYGAELDERGRQYVSLAADGARRMQVLIRDVLALARIGKLDKLLVPVDLADALGQAVANLSVQIEASGGELTTSSLPVVKADPALMVALFQNLLANSLKFKSAGVPPKVEVWAGPDGADWRFRFSDNGIGIEAAYAERVFEMFQRLHRRDEYTGTGIGLALCRRIVEHHGGRMWLDTSQPAGTSFEWSWPSAMVLSAGGGDG